jgi:probable rRNA maturation factor
MTDRREISIFNGTGTLRFEKREIASMFSLLDSTEFRIAAGELSIAFLDRNSMCLTHAKFLGDSSLTDVITFSGDRGMNFAGEICVSPDCALASHVAHSTTFSEELTLYLVHGYLHLSGLDDVSEFDEEKMRNGENFCMKLIISKNILPKFFYAQQ